jgi:aspartate/methionine/tyrosine aminotransferase
VLRERAAVVQRIVGDPVYADLWEAYPFNAGYFMCLRLRHLDAEEYRKHLLVKYGVGVIADGKHDIRVAFSAVDADKLPDLFALLAAAARDLIQQEPV